MQADIFINLDMYVVPANISAILLPCFCSLSLKLYILVIKNIARCLWQFCNFNVGGSFKFNYFLDFKLQSVTK